MAPFRGLPHTTGSAGGLDSNEHAEDHIGGGSPARSPRCRILRWYKFKKHNGVDSRLCGFTDPGLGNRRLEGVCQKARHARGRGTGDARFSRRGRTDGLSRTEYLRRRDLGADYGSAYRCLSGSLQQVIR